VSLGNTSPEKLKAELLKYNNVENVATASHIPAAGMTFGSGYKRSLEEKE
jgi:hypothetical protein